MIRERPPPEIRQAILDQEGVWSLSISENENTAKVMMALRSALGLSISELSQFRERIPGTLISGTAVEMKIIQLFLYDVGVNAELQQIHN